VDVGVDDKHGWMTCRGGCLKAGANLRLKAISGNAARHVLLIEDSD
jgi:hypothetical protein